jgi:hypothetical protein
MGMKDHISKGQAWLEWIKVNKGLSVDIVDIATIPKVWEHFPGSQDLWCEVIHQDDLNRTGCDYIGLSGSIFSGHEHPNNVEILTVLNEMGRIQFWTPTRNGFRNHGESIMFEKGEPHIVMFIGIDKSETIIGLVWHPKMKGWEARSSTVES